MESLSDTCARMHYLVAGTFNTVFLYLVAFSPYTNPPTLEVAHAYRAEGPHQFLAVNDLRDRVYATTWAQPPSLSSWRVLDRDRDGRPGLARINTVPISATGSYISVLADPVRVYQAGGPVAQTFAVEPTSGAIGAQLAQEVYLNGGDAELWHPDTDRTRVALRYGSHAIDLDPVHHRAYVPHVGRDSIYVYRVDPTDGRLDRLGEVPTFGRKGHEGPRHSIPSRNGDKLYVVTEHTSYLDVYDVVLDAPYLVHSRRFSVIPRFLDPVRSQYRGDTLRLSRDGTRLYVTTRGKTASEKGYVSVWNVDGEGDGSIVEVVHDDDDDDDDEHDDNVAGIERDDGRDEEEEEEVVVERRDRTTTGPPSSRVGYGAVHRYETKTSGGKANAIEVFPFARSRPPPPPPSRRRRPSSSQTTTASGEEVKVEKTEKETETETDTDKRGEDDLLGDWIVLTDDELGWVTVLEWTGPVEGLVEVAKVQLGTQPGAERDESGTGASHAVWLS